jgi:TolB protein
MKAPLWFAVACATVAVAVGASLVLVLSSGSHARAAPRPTSACTLAPGPVPRRPSTGTLAFVRYDGGSYSIFVLRPGRAPRRLSAAPATHPPASRNAFQDTPTWSPDGRRVAFASDRNGRSGIYVMRANGTGTRRLSISTRGDTAPSWSPDGRWIVFARALRGLYVMHPDGSDARPLAHAIGGKDTDPAWSPDGSRIAFVRRQPGIGSALFLTRPNGRGLCELTRITGSDSDPAWSPDGRWLAYSTGDGSGFGIAVVRADGTHRRMLTPQGLDFQPAWSPDGREIVFTREATLYVMNRDGTGIRRLTNPRAIDGSPAWRPASA